MRPGAVGANCTTQSGRALLQSDRADQRTDAVLARSESEVEYGVPKVVDSAADAGKGAPIHMALV